MEEEQVIARPGNFKAKLITGVAMAVILPVLASVIIGALPVAYLEKVFYSRFIYWVEVLLLLFYAYKVERQPLLIWKDRKLTFLYALVSIIALYFISEAMGVVSNIPHLLGWKENDAIMRKVIAVLKNRDALLVFVALTAGVTEELIFRGYVFTRLSLLFKNGYMPVIISSVLFSAMHYKYNSLREYIFVFLIGVIYSLYYKKYRNIKVLMTVHFMVDVISLLLAEHIVK
jgi:membrane protease YdiL (CAAX protease family)